MPTSALRSTGPGAPRTMAREPKLARKYLSGNADGLRRIESACIESHERPLGSLADKRVNSILSFSTRGFLACEEGITKVMQ